MTVKSLNKYHLILVFSFLIIDLSVDAGELDEIPVYVVSHAWHTGISISMEDWEKAGGEHFPHLEEMAFIELGWGDERYYTHRGFSLWLGIRALLWPTSSVMHVSGFLQSPEKSLTQERVTKIYISQNELKSLVSKLMGYFTKVDGQIVEFSDQGLYGMGIFYESTASYHLFHTCNVWTARRLREIGVEVRPWRSITVRGLVRQLQ